MSWLCQNTQSQLELLQPVYITACLQGPKGLDTFHRSRRHFYCRSETSSRTSALRDRANTKSIPFFIIVYIIISMGHLNIEEIKRKCILFCIKSKSCSFRFGVKKNRQQNGTASSGHFWQLHLDIPLFVCARAYVCMCERARVCSQRTGSRCLEKG